MIKDRNGRSKDAGCLWGKASRHGISGAGLSQAELREANLSGANLIRASLPDHRSAITDQRRSRITSQAARYFLKGSCGRGSDSFVSGWTPDTYSGEGMANTA